MHVYTALLISPAVKASEFLYAPVSIPRPSGQYAMMETPSSRHAFSSPTSGRSISRQNGEYSTCSAWIGCTAYARRSVSSPQDERARYLTLPSLRGWSQRWCVCVCMGGRGGGEGYLTSSAMAPTVSSMGTLTSTLSSLSLEFRTYTQRAGERACRTGGSSRGRYGRRRVS